MPGRIIETLDCVAEGADWLAAREPRLAHALTLCGPLPLRRKPAGFAALLDAIVGQQVSVASARAIWARLDGAGLTGRRAMAAASDDALRGAGLSRQKARYARALACSDIDFDGLSAFEDEDLVRVLTQVPGIGRWTAEIYAMFALGRADVLAAGDLALQVAAQDLFALPARPTDAQLREMARAWSPWRAVAARLLWSYYHHLQGREGTR